jgi:hypothetical protein
LKGFGLISDPWLAVGDNPTDSAAKFSGAATPDVSNPGRYTIPLVIGQTGFASDFQVVAYQASGGELLWLDEDLYSVFLGSLQQQPSLTGLPAATVDAPVRVRPKR